MINTLDGNTFALMIISGANNLKNNRQKVDDLNVFPVPDGDTGTNMSLTVSAVSKEALVKNSSSLTKAADAMSFAALRGARGNSGVILSQLFRGISKSFKGKSSCNALELANALTAGSEAAYKAVMSPTEGTILTVAREAANGALLCASKDTDITNVVEAALNRGSRALARTPDMLPALKQAGVVDAGGQGWIYVLDGALRYLKTGSIIEAEEAEETVEKTAAAAVRSDIRPEDIKYKYCTEFIIEKKNKNSSADVFKTAISPKGDSMLVIDDEDIVKVHIHTNHPGFVLEEAVKLGDLINLKIDNMKHQHKSLLQLAGDTEAGKTEESNSEEKVTAKASLEEKAEETVKSTKKTAKSKADAPAKSEKKRKEPKKPVEEKKTGFVAVCSGRGFSKLLKDLGVDRVIEGGQTMNPSAEDIIKGIKRVKAKTVFVFPNNKNIIMAAQQAAKLTENTQVIVIPTTSVPGCISAMMAYNENKDSEQNEKTMIKAAASVKTGQVTYAVRDTEIEGVKIHKNDIIGITEGEIAVAGNDIGDVLEETINQLVDEDSEYITVYAGRDAKKSQYEPVLKGAEAKYAKDEIEISLKKGGQPVYYYIVSVE